MREGINPLKMRKAEVNCLRLFDWIRGYTIVVIIILSFENMRCRNFSVIVQNWCNWPSDKGCGTFPLWDG